MHALIWQKEGEGGRVAFISSVPATPDSDPTVGPDGLEFPMAACGAICCCDLLSAGPLPDEVAAADETPLEAASAPAPPVGVD